MRILLVFIVSFALSFPSAAQEYDTPIDYRNVERVLSENLRTCLHKAQTYPATLQCADNLMDVCTSRAVHGSTTAGLAICGGVISNVIDREINAVWNVLKDNLEAAEFEDLLFAQRDWLGFRQRESVAAAQEYTGGSMGAYTGWFRYNELSGDRLARLHEIRRGL